VSYVLSESKAELSKQVKEVFEEHRSRYGALRISKEFQSQGIRIGRHQTQTLMKKQSLVAIQWQRPTV
jgi:putative transposase